MKLTVLLLTAAFFQVYATGTAQSVTLSGKNISLRQVFSAIEEQTGYVVFYNKEAISSATPVSLTVYNMPLTDLLDFVLKEQSLEYVIKEKSVILSRKHPDIPPPQSAVFPMDTLISIKGKVMDEKGNPLEGAVIGIIGNRRQVATNFNGEFMMPYIDGKAILTVSYVGYKTQEIRLKTNQRLVNIVMEPTNSKMDEVVISTGIFKKVDKSFTGSSTTVTAKELQQFGNRNLIVSLRNIDPAFNIIESNTMGSDPNRLPDIQIRGNSSLPNVNNLDDLVGLNTPLIILDGFQSTLQKMLDININEVESVTILKDASATAIYGSRGSNGVVVITTKLPKPGALRVAYRGDLNIEAADLSDYHVLDARQKLELERKVGLYDNTIVERDIQLKRYYNFLLNEVNSGVNTYWLDMPLRTGVGQRHNFSVSGGDQTFRYAASVQVNDIQGVMKGSERKTLNGTVSLAYNLKNIKFSNQLMITEGRSGESSYGSFGDYVRMNPYWRAFDDKGNVLKFMGDPGNNDFELRWSSASLPTSPLYNATLNVFDKTKTSELINNSSVEWTISKELQVRAQLGLTKNTQQKDKFRPASHTAFANYSTTDLFRRGDYNYGIANGMGYDGGLNLQYSATYDEKHTLFAGLDYNIRQSQNSAYSFLAEGFTNPNFDFISMALQYAKDQKPGGSESLSRAMGLTGNVNYIYDNRFFADASLRMDGSSQFGKNNRMAPFWSAGLGWNLHNEAFLKDSRIIERLKLRGSAGITGSQNFDAYQALSTYRYYTNDRYFSWNGAYLLGLGNEDLRWQQALKYDIGFDAEFLKGRLKITADYYTSTTRDLLSSIALKASNGFPSYVENVGRMGNKGFEIRGTGILISQPLNGFFWSITAGVVQNRNKILETSVALKDAQRDRQMQAGDVPTALYFEGYSTNTIWVVPSLGIDPSNGKEVYIDINGKPTYIWSGNDLRAMGNSDPDFMGNFSTMFRYKTLALNASFGYRLGGQLYNQTLISRVENADYRYNVDARVYSDRWVMPGDQVAFKGLMVSGATYRSSRFIQNENTLICRNINLQYDLRSDYLRRTLHLTNLQFTANMADPFRFSGIKQERGTVYPFSKQFSLSISATF